MSWRYGSGNSLYTEGGALTASSLATVLTSGGGIGTKGAYVQLIASTTYAAKGIIVEITGNAAGFLDIVDIAVGAGGSEVVLLPDLLGGQATTVICTNRYFFPCSIPAGTRISARNAGSINGTTVQVAVQLLHAGMLDGGYGNIVKAYGVDTANAVGTLVTGNASANTKGSYSQLTASTSQTIEAMVVALTEHATITPSKWQLVDIAVGAGGSEVVVLSNLQFAQQDSGDNFYELVSGPFPCNIPAATRLSARLQGDTGSQVFKLAVYGIS